MAARPAQSGHGPVAVSTPPGLAGIKPGEFELADLPLLPVMTKAQMIASFDQIVTDRRLTRRVVERHLACSTLAPSLLLGDYVCLISGGSSGLRGLFVQTAEEYAEFGGAIKWTTVAMLMASGVADPFVAIWRVDAIARDLRTAKSKRFLPLES